MEVHSASFWWWQVFDVYAATPVDGVTFTLHFSRVFVLMESAWNAFWHQSLGGYWYAHQVIFINLKCFAFLELYVYIWAGILYIFFLLQNTVHDIILEYVCLCFILICRGKEHSAPNVLDFCQTFCSWESYVQKPVFSCCAFCLF